MTKDGTWKLELAKVGTKNAKDLAKVHGTLTINGKAFPVYLGDVWVLHLADPMRWEHLQPGGPAPSARGFASVIYDPTR